QLRSSLAAPTGDLSRRPIGRARLRRATQLLQLLRIRAIGVIRGQNVYATLTCDARRKPPLFAQHARFTHRFPFSRCTQIKEKKICVNLHKSADKSEDETDWRFRFRHWRPYRRQSSA